MKLDKRLGYVLVSSFYLFILGVLYVFNLATYQISIVIAVILVSLFAYFVSFKNQQIDKFIYFVILVFATNAFLNFFPSLNMASIIIYIAGVTLGVYLNLLAINIYNVSEKADKAIPLLQAAKLVIFIALILIVFLLSTITYKIYFDNLSALLNLIAQLILFLGIYFALFRSIINWFFYEDKAGEYKAKNMLVSVESLRRFMVIYLIQMSFVLMFTRLEDFGRGLFLAANMYILVSFVQAVIGRTLNRRFFIESVSILLLIYLIIFYL